jgi:hypothetical protein
VSIRVSAHLLPFTLALASAARLFTAAQLARHPDLSWRTQPIKRAHEFLRRHQTLFERHPGPALSAPHRWRLTTGARRRLGIAWVPPAGTSAKSEHWLALGDVWLALTFAGGRPSEWQVEPDGQFDVYCLWQGVPLLIEVQRTPITARQWHRKWEQRLTWYRSRAWAPPARVVLVDLTGQQAETVCVPRGTIRVTRVEDAPRAILRAVSAGKVYTVANS